MNCIKLLTPVFALACLMASCGNDSKVEKYVVNITCASSAADSVTLKIYDADYQNLRTLNAGRLRDGRLTLSGQIKQQAIAFLDYGTKKPISFILEKCETDIEIGKEKAVIWGGVANHRFHSLCHNVYTLQKHIAAQEQAYRKALADSTLTKATEASLLKRHKTLSDSLQATILATINRGDEVAMLAKERFFNLLDSTTLKRLK
ncbi:MAG: hypothetical protein Q4B68_00210 [Bacteroidales bacterium]|nr:hypothetical protein [Bacteroidales bacterium]